MKKILVVDDNNENIELIRAILEDTIACDTAISGSDCLRKYEECIQKGNPYELILLDISMPDVNGLEVLNTIRTNEQKRGIDLGKGMPIIMITAYKEPFADAFKSGCDDYILKPINPDLLKKKLNNFLFNLK